MSSLKNRIIETGIPSMDKARVIGLLIKKQNPDKQQVVITKDELEEDMSITFDYSDEGVLITVI